MEGERAALVGTCSWMVCRQTAEVTAFGLGMGGRLVTAVASAVGLTAGCGSARRYIPDASRCRRLFRRRCSGSRRDGYGLSFADQAPVLSAVVADWPVLLGSFGESVHLLWVRILC